MSMDGISSNSGRIFKKRMDSDDLDVLETARYLSSYNLEPPNSAHSRYKLGRMRDRWGIGGGRISLDLPIQSAPTNAYFQQRCYHDYSSLEKKSAAPKEKSATKHKQPSSPGGRIASFLNSLFHQGRSKKKSKSSSQSEKEEDETPGWRRRRRSSISKFILNPRKNKGADPYPVDSSSKALHTSSTSSGFRTPPPFTNTPTKSFQELLNHTRLKQLDDQRRKSKDLSWLDEKLNLIECLSEKQRVWVDRDHRRDTVDPKLKGKEKYIRKFSDNHGQNVGDDDEDGAESDSSSDLFELQNYELANGGLPVYETTDVGSIKIVAPASNG